MNEPAPLHKVETERIFLNLIKNMCRPLQLICLMVNCSFFRPGTRQAGCPSSIFLFHLYEGSRWKIAHAQITKQELPFILVACYMVMYVENYKQSMKIHLALINECCGLNLNYLLKAHALNFSCQMK